MAADLNAGTIKVTVAGDAAGVQRTFNTVSKQAQAAATATAGAFKQATGQLDLFEEALRKAGQARVQAFTKQIQLPFQGDIPGRQFLLPLENAVENVTKETQRAAVAADQLTLEFDKSGAAAERAARLTEHMERNTFQGVRTTNQLEEHWESIGRQVFGTTGSVEKFVVTEQKAIKQAVDLENHWENINAEINRSSTTSMQHQLPFGRGAQLGGGGGRRGREALDFSANASTQKVGMLQRALRKLGLQADELGGKSNKGALAVSQLGFAAEDFLTVIQTGGLGMAIRSAGNNLSFLAAQVKPMAGLFVGVGLAVTAIVLPALIDLGKSLFDTGKDAEEAEERTRALEQALRDLGRAAFDAQNALDISLRTSSISEAEGVFSPVLDRFQRQRKQYEKELDEARNELDRVQLEMISSSNDALGSIGQDTTDFVQSWGGMFTGMFPNFAGVAGDEIEKLEKEVERRLRGERSPDGPADLRTEMGIQADLWGEMIKVIQDRAQTELTSGMRDTLQEAFRQAVESGDVEGIEFQLRKLLEDPLAAITPETRKLLEQSGVADSIEVTEEYRENLVKVADELTKLAKEGVDTAADMAKLNAELDKLGRNEGLRKFFDQFVGDKTQQVQDTITRFRELFNLTDLDLDAGQKAFEEMEKREQEANAILEKNLTPLEKFTKEYERLEELQKEFPGIIDQEQFDRQVNGLEEEFARLTKPETKTINIRTATVDQVGVGTAEAVTRFQQFADRRGAELENAPALPQLQGTREAAKAARDAAFLEDHNKAVEQEGGVRVATAEEARGRVHRERAFAEKFLAEGGDPDRLNSDDFLDAFNRLQAAREGRDAPRPVVEEIREEQKNRDENSRQLGELNQTIKDLVTIERDKAAKLGEVVLGLF